MNPLFKCSNCLDERSSEEIIQLQCRHRYCLICINSYILKKLSDSIINIKCPMPECNELISDKEIRDIISDEQIEKYEIICYKKLPHTYFHCLLPDCNLMVEYENIKSQYVCPNCSLFNCIYCKASHIDMKCHQYKNNPKAESENICNKEMKKAQFALSERLREGIVDASKNNLLFNKEVFTCIICDQCIGKRKGIMLRNCYHLICRTCLISHIKETKKFPPICPCNCVFSIEDREIKEVLNVEEYRHYEKKRNNSIKPLLLNTFQCQAPDCDYFCEVLDANLKMVKCLKCQSENCVSCRAIHGKEKCKEYKLRIESTDIGKSNKMIEEEIVKGEIMRCPGCQAVVENTGICSLVSCIHCNMELCWAKRTSRWGLKGTGDTSGGCQCMVNGILCDPNCGGCDRHNKT